MSVFINQIQWVSLHVLFTYCLEHFQRDSSRSHFINDLLKTEKMNRKQISFCLKKSFTVLVNHINCLVFMIYYARTFRALKYSHPLCEALQKWIGLDYSKFYKSTGQFTNLQKKPDKVRIWIQTESDRGVFTTQSTSKIELFAKMVHVF